MKNIIENSEFITTVYDKDDNGEIIGGYRDKDLAIKMGKASIKENPEYIYFEVDLYDGYNSETVYQEDKKRNEDVYIIEIQEEVKIGNVILEKGDRIRVLIGKKVEEAFYPNNKKVRDLIYKVGIDEVIGSVIHDLQDSPEPELAEFLSDIKKAYQSLQKGKAKIGDRYYE